MSASKNRFADMSREELQLECQRLSIGLSPSSAGSAGLRHAVMQMASQHAKNWGCHDHAAPSMLCDFAMTVLRMPGAAQRPTEPHETTYLRGWNEGIERAIELLEADGWSCPNEVIRPLLDDAPQPASNEDRGEPEDLAQLLRRVRDGSVDAECEIIRMVNARRKELDAASSVPSTHDGSAA